MFPNQITLAAAHPMPLCMAEDYSYDIGIRLNCDVYIGRYESATDYLPAVFAPQHTVDVRFRNTSCM